MEKIAHTHIYKGHTLMCVMKTNCDYCRNEIDETEVIHKHDDLDICESCHEGAIA